MDYEVVMGLEVHVELATESKIFCSCSAKFGADANENVCPACSGMPGYLPVTNKKAVELGIKAGLVTNCNISNYTCFDKKNYYYPDLSTAYQITQFYAPICTNGSVEIETSQGKKSITIKQIHLEEDAGKLLHEPWTNSSLIDYNRASVPLVEIVSNPDFRTSDEVIAYLEKLRSLLRFAGVSDCKMQEGSMRADINISVRPKGSTKLGTRTEMKNMNSLKAIARAISFESERHIEALEHNTEELIQETRRWDDDKNESFSMRSKEDATDYRYFPNPDLMPIIISEEMIEEIRKSLPELADAKCQRLMKDFNLPEYDCKILTGSKALSDIFDEAVENCNKPKEVSNWIIVELMALANIDGKAFDDIKLDGKKLAAIIKMVEGKKINRNAAKEIFAEVYKNNVDPETYAEENQMGMVSDDGLILEIINKVIAENPKSIQDYKDGKGKAVGFLIGKIMKETNGKADPKLANEMLTNKLNEI